ncbi:MAG: DNA-protecting protein DprA [Acidimicrobiia bacterium]|nr:DNA-protecting protein DprA [Acidimicrobiia bacterium]
MTTERESALYALVALPRMTPSRLQRALHIWPDPIDAVKGLASGAAIKVIGDERRLNDEGRSQIVAGWRMVDVLSAARVIKRNGTRLRCLHDDDWPIEEEDTTLPAVLLNEGDRPCALAAQRVAIVGTRAASPHGVADAHALAATLAEAGITIVSGLALGIDAAAHRGAIEAGGQTIGVVATGLDVTYPRSHQSLYASVRSHGIIVSEHPHGVGPRPERFPVRNRIIAALADVVVVVEAASRGGALSTAAAATALGRPVLAQPGSTRNPVAAGCNSLIADGALPLLDASDVVIALGMTSGSRRAPIRNLSAATKPTLPADNAGRQVMRALGGEPASLDEIALRTNLDAPGIARAVESLCTLGLAKRVRGLIWPL